MWITVTMLNGNRTLIDLSKVQQMNEHKEGTQILFNMAVPNKEGIISARSLVVREQVDDIARTLKSKAVGR